MPRPDNKRDKERPTSGIPDSILDTIPITSGLAKKCAIWVCLETISDASPDKQRKYERNLRAPAAVLVLSSTSIKHVPPSLIGASISKLRQVAESINN